MQSATAAHRVLQVRHAATAADLAACFESFVPDITASLETFLASQLQQWRHIGPAVEQTIADISAFTLGGGKRIRPRFAWAGYLSALTAASSTPLSSTPSASQDTPAQPEAVLPTIAALELIQACALIHDDIIDASDLRRGKPTLHKQTEAQHRQAGSRGDSATYGTSIAILAGDIAHVWADDMFQGSGANAASLMRALPHWQHMRTEVIGGQILDIALEATGIPPLDPAVLAALRDQTQAVNSYKTAAYTIARPLQLGAALGGAAPHVVESLATYGLHVGLGFQLRDDLLGVFGDPAVTGKPAGDDLREGKVTELILASLELLNDAPDQAEQLRAALGEVTTDAEIAQLRDIIAASGAVDSIEKQISHHRATALQALEPLNLGAMYDVLEQLAEQATARQY